MLSTARKAGFRGMLETDFQRPRFMARNYLTTLDTMPTPPASFDYASDVKDGFPMALNDRYGDCTIAGFVHLVQILYAAVGETFAYPGDDVVQQTYFQLTGGADTGLQLEQVLNAAVTNGLFGVKLFGFMEVDVRDTDLLTQATYVFGSFYGGFEMPHNAEQQFEMGMPFTVSPGLNPGVGGHCMIGSGGQATGLDLITWGAETGCAWDWWRLYGTQAIIVIPELWVEKNHAPLANIDLASLQADMKTIGQSN